MTGPRPASSIPRVLIFGRGGSGIKRFYFELLKNPTQLLRKNSRGGSSQTSSVRAQTLPCLSITIPPYIYNRIAGVGFEPHDLEVSDSSCYGPREHSRLLYPAGVSGGGELLKVALVYFA